MGLSTVSELTSIPQQGSSRWNRSSVQGSHSGSLFWSEEQIWILRKSAPLWRSSLKSTAETLTISLQRTVITFATTFVFSWQGDPSLVGLTVLLALVRSLPKKKKDRTLVYSVLILCFSKKGHDFLCFVYLVLGLFCNCVLPAELNETKVRQVRSKEEKVPEAEEKKLRSRSSRFPPGPSLSSSGSLNRSRRGGGERRRQCLPPSPPVSA